MDTYNSYISQFQVYENPPKNDGYHRHHIVPEDEQRKLYGEVIDQRQIYVTPAQHLWCHILYDREHGTKTSAWFLSVCGRPISYFDCWEKCLAYSYTLSKKWTGFSNHNHTDKTRNKMSMSHAGHPCYHKEDTAEKISKTLKERHYTTFKGHHHTEDTKRSNAEAHTGANNVNYGKKWCNNGVIEKYCDTCPAGFVFGRLKKTL